MEEGSKLNVVLAEASSYQARTRKQWGSIQRRMLQNLESSSLYSTECWLRERNELYRTMGVFDGVDLPLDSPAVDNTRDNAQPPSSGENQAPSSGVTASSGVEGSVASAGAAGAGIAADNAEDGATASVGRALGDEVSHRHLQPVVAKRKEWWRLDFTEGPNRMRRL
jgi:hypothetical protein